MNFLRNIFSSLISFFLVPLLLAYIIFSSLFGVLLDATKVKTTLNNTGTFSQLSSNIIPTLLINTASQTGSETAIPKPALEEIISNVDKKALAADLEKVFDSSYEYLTTEKTSFETKIDLTKYSTSISANLKPTLENYFNSLPACTTSQETQINQNTATNISCRPKNLTTAKYLQELDTDSLASDLKTSLPTTLIVSEKQISTYPKTALFEDKAVEQNQESSNKNFFTNLKKSISSYQAFSQYLLFLIIVLFFLLVLSRLPKISSICKWSSSALFSASIIPLVFATFCLYFIKPDFFRSGLTNILGNRVDSTFQNSIVSLISANLYSFSKLALADIQRLSFILIVFAIVLYALYFFLERKPNPKANKPLDELSPSTHNINNKTV